MYWHLKNEIEAIAEDYWISGIRHIVALRGDKRDESEKEFVISNMQLT